MASALRPRRIKFDVPGTNQKYRKAFGFAFDKAAKGIERSIKKSINTQGPPRSLPGRSPRKESGFLHDNVQVFRQGFKIIVRVPQYGIFLEGGTSRMAARPFIRKVVEQKKWAKQINRDARSKLK